MLAPTTVLILSLLGGFAQSGSKPIESAHVSGPNGLEGWTLSYVIEGVEDQGPLPTTLVISRNGKIVRRIHDEPFLWKWKFESNGKFVAYEKGPLHFSMDCELVDLASGKLIANYDCYHMSPPKVPHWVEELESQ